MNGKTWKSANINFEWNMKISSPLLLLQLLFSISSSSSSMENSEKVKFISFGDAKIFSPNDYYRWLPIWFSQKFELWHSLQNFSHSQNAKNSKRLFVKVISLILTNKSWMMKIDSWWNFWHCGLMKSFDRAQKKVLISLLSLTFNNDSWW